MPFYILPHKYLIYSFCSASRTLVHPCRGTIATHIRPGRVPKLPTGNSIASCETTRKVENGISGPATGEEEERDRQALLRIPVTIYMSTKEIGIHSGERTRKKRQRYFLRK